MFTTALLAPFSPSKSDHGIHSLAFTDDLFPYSSQKSATQKVGDTVRSGSDTTSSHSKGLAQSVTDTVGSATQGVKDTLGSATGNK